MTTITAFKRTLVRFNRAAPLVELVEQAVSKVEGARIQVTDVEVSTNFVRAILEFGRERPINRDELREEIGSCLTAVGLEASLVQVYGHGLGIINLTYSRNGV